MTLEKSTKKLQAKSQHSRSSNRANDLRRGSDINTEEFSSFHKAHSLASPFLSSTHSLALSFSMEILFLKLGNQRLTYIHTLVTELLAFTRVACTCARVIRQEIMLADEIPPTKVRELNRH